LFAEIKVQRLLIIRRTLKSQKDLFGGHTVFLLSRERGHVTALVTLKAKMVCYPNLKAFEVIINNVVFMFS